MEYAGFWRRFFAAWIDGIITFVISLILSLLAANSVATSILISLLYLPFFESSRLQATPGKLFLGIRVVNMQGQRITFKVAMIRFAVRIVSGLILLIGFLLALFTEKKQTLHDLVANTLVIKGEIKGINVFEAWYQQVLAVLGMVDKVPPETTTGATSSSATGFTGTESTFATDSSTPTQVTPADLAGLYELFQKGILTEAEYNEKRAELLKKL